MAPKTRAAIASASTPKRVTRSAAKAITEETAREPPAKPTSTKKSPAKKAPAKKVSSTTRSIPVTKAPSKTTPSKKAASAQAKAAKSLAPAAQAKQTVKAPADKTSPVKAAAATEANVAGIEGTPAKDAPVESTTSESAPTNEVKPRQSLTKKDKKQASAQPAEEAASEATSLEDTPVTEVKPRQSSTEGGKKEASFKANPQPQENGAQSKKRKAKQGASRKSIKLSQKDSPATNAGDQLLGAKIFVGQLPWKVNDEQLASIFAQVGPVKSAHVQMDQEKNRSRGIGFVEFEAVADAEKALKTMQQHEVHGRQIRVAAAAPESKSDRQGRKPRNLAKPSAILFVGGLPKDIATADVHKTFAKYGKITSVRMPEDPATGKLKGFAHVEFSTVGQAEKALKTPKGIQFKGKSVFLDFAPPRSTKAQ